MIRGKVNSRFEAAIPPTVLGASDQRHTITAVIDTGYNGFLTLPLSIVESTRDTTAS